MSFRNQNPPKYALTFLRYFCKPELFEEISGDLTEEFNLRMSRFGTVRAVLYFWFQVISFLQPFSVKKIQFKLFINFYIMFTHYLKIALRNLWHQKLASVINIFSLSLGIGCAILIFLFIQNEWFYDSFHEKKDQIHRIRRVVYNGAGNIEDGIEGHPMPFGQAIKEDFPEVLEITRLYDMDDYVKAGNSVKERTLYFADTSFFQIFSFPFLKGNPLTALKKQNDMVITQSMAKELFGQQEAIGETLHFFFDGSFHPFQIVGVLKDIPPNSTLDFEALIPFSFLENHGFGETYRDSWSISFVRAYALLRPETQLTELSEKTIEFCNKHFTYRDGIHERYGADSYYAETFQPISDVHFDQNIETSLGERGKRNHSYILAMIALIILTIGCINFTILSIGRSSSRTLEIGIRKVIGAHSKQIRNQFLGESLLLSFISLALGIVLAMQFLPQFNELSNRDLQLSTLIEPGSILFLLAFTAITGLVAGLYPARFVSSFKPISIISNKLKLGGTNLFTNSLVTIQFILSIILVIVTLVMGNQLRYMKNKDLGFKGEMLIVIQRQGQERENFFKVFKNELSRDPRINQITATNPAFTHGSMTSSFEYEGSTVEYHITFVQSNYLETMGIDLVQGRNFIPGSSTDSNEHILVNEAFVRALGWEDPIGKPVKGLSNAGVDEPVIIGVTRNFHYQSLEHPVTPIWMALSEDDNLDDLVVKIQGDDVRGAISKMESVWNGLADGIPFNYSFLDEDMAALYHREERWNRIISISCIMAVIIAYIGMFGLIALSLAGRTKEMNIRKILGASLRQITVTLTSQFAKITLVALFIATPIAWYLSSEWLEGYAYHIAIKPGIFMIAFALIVMLFILTIVYHVWRTSKLNPADVLRNNN